MCVQARMIIYHGPYISEVCADVYMHIVSHLLRSLYFFLLYEERHYPYHYT
jgi:hypothetical protein